MERIKEIDNRGEVKDSILATLKQAYELKEQDVGFAQMREMERIVMLRVIDKAWIEQLHNMDTLREGIGLRGIGGRDPLVEYKIEGYAMFQDMMRGVREEVVGMIYKVQFVSKETEEEQPKRKISYGAVQKSAPVQVESKQIKVGRNDPCPCGSGKKYKKCCFPREDSRGLPKEGSEGE